MTANKFSTIKLFIIFAFFCVFAVGKTNAASRIDIQAPAGVGQFGQQIYTLPNGNIVTTSRNQYFGSIYLYNGETGALISTTTRRYGNFSVTVLPNGNYVVYSTSWDSSGASDGGATTWCSKSIGCPDEISPDTSLVGTGYWIYVLANGNYVVSSPDWDNGTATDAGAITWCNGETGCRGVISPANSLVGTSAADRVGGVYILPNGNFVVSTRAWDNGSEIDAGAVTWCNGKIGCTGEISASNSLVGAKSKDYLGWGEVSVLPNGNYVVKSPYWDNGGIINVGAVTWGNGLGGTVGTISVSNSLIGTQRNDLVGFSYLSILPNGNYIIQSPKWDNGQITDAGAVTWANGWGGTVGTVSPENSLVGTSVNDSVGNSQAVVLTNGNYVVGSRLWDRDGIADAGAVTWGNGLGGTVGFISAANSLVGSRINDFMWLKVEPLSNGNYVIANRSWDNGALVDAGAVTWGNGLGSTIGEISASNSLVGNKSGDNVGVIIVPLSNGNYVTATFGWDNGASIDVGAATWGDGLGGTVGAVSLSNSLIGLRTADFGSVRITVLTNGHYIVSNSSWDNDGIQNVGAVTWCNGFTGTVGIISRSNSLIGIQPDDRVGEQGIFPLSNGNYVVNSNLWNNFGAEGYRGAVTWGNGLGGTFGAVSEYNSLIGTQDQQHNGNGYNRIFTLPNGNYFVVNRNWRNGTLAQRGAVTWGNGFIGTSGVVSPDNSLVGTQGNDLCCSSEIEILPNSNLIIRSRNFFSTMGAVSLVAGNGGTVGMINSKNSVRGRFGFGDMMFSYNEINETLVVGSRFENIVSIFKPTYTAIADGDWADGATWDYGAFRKPHDVLIPNGRTVNLDGVKAVNSLNIGCAGAVAGADSSRYIVGAVKKDFCSAGAFSFPTGTANGFSPVDVNITSLAANPSSLTVRAAQNAHPQLDPNNSLGRFWSIAETGDLTADLIFNYADADVFGDESSYKLFRVAGGVPTKIAPFTLNTSANTISTNGVSEFSDWAVGNLAK
jgi:hypothetical protein